MTGGSGMYRPPFSARPGHPGRRNSSTLTSSCWANVEAYRTARRVSITPAFSHLRIRGALADNVRRFVDDSPVEEAGFELTVPRDTSEFSRGAHVASS